MPGIGVAPGGTVMVPCGVVWPMPGSPGLGRRCRRGCGCRLRGRLSDERRRPAEAEVLLRPDVNRPEICLRNIRRADDTRRHQHDDVGLGNLLVVIREQLLQHRYVDRAREPVQRASLVLAQQTGQQIRFTIVQAKPRRHFPVAEGRDVDAADVDVAAPRVVDDGDVEQDVALERDPRRHVDVDADVLVPVRAQRVDARAAAGDRQVAGGDDRNLIADLQASASCLLRPAAAASRRASCSCRIRGTSRSPWGRRSRSRRS